MTLKTGDRLYYKHDSLSQNHKPLMYLEFIEGERVTCSYLERDGSETGVVRTIVLHIDSVVKA